MSSAANNLNYIAMMYNRCFCYIVTPLGIVGHLLNIYVFTRPSLVSNPCSRYFLAAAIVGIMNTCYTVPIRMIQTGYVNADPGAYSIVFCKIGWLFLYALRASACWSMVLVCADRYLCSAASTTMRAMSSVRVANRAIPLTILIIFIAYIHVPIFFKIDFVSATQTSTCNSRGPAGAYRTILYYFDLIVYGLSPSFFMLLFGLLTLRNVQQSKRLIVMPVANQTNRKTNNQMLRMLIVQVLVYCVTGLVFSATIIYTSMNPPTNSFQVGQYNMVYAVVGMGSNIGPCLSFYLFTLSSALFRKELKNLFCRGNRIHNQTQQHIMQASNTARAPTRNKT
ncbi:unnamed protein product [Adineta steineri]|uniref:G-protein coupled receptors family 1 profile domain-containing protein n=1 Tax=Adineta steineri TaxID=433720 RepID=A0A814QRC6_9BILA|nr:unnamed protein product [Adineta steineri]CAF1121849.1 unnamed protein product [Adineta steineri]